jgi:(3R)-3-hydroxyacyl-CoA dehydrogenase / 3a,7a,12a-trihydroxy-5b-cholest-24-enoyl-CoA hydratase / enoyl-CoA hydratase 2
MPTLAQVQALYGLEQPPLTFTYTERDVALYALGVGAPADWLDPKELQFVYELSGDGFRVLPTFPAIYTSGMIHQLVSGKIGEVEFNPMMLVHGEQAIEIKKPLPTRGTITSHPKIRAAYDKGSGLLVITDVSCRDESGDEIALATSSMFIRGIGGFGGERGPSGEANVPPDRAPDAVIEETTLERQALIYRLSGDINPLHADPMMAAMGGFDRPILHGLCTFGFAVRAVLKAFCDNDSSRVKKVAVRFSKHVFPGDTLVTEMWKTSEREIVFRTTVKGRDAVALSHAAVTLV